MTNVSEIKKGKTTFSGSYPEPLVDEIKFKIVQDGFCLLGEGTTPDEACENAVEWINLPDIKTGQDVRNLLTNPSERFHGCITMLYIGDEDFDDYRESRFSV